MDLPTKFHKFPLRNHCPPSPPGLIFFTASLTSSFYSVNSVIIKLKFKSWYASCPEVFGFPQSDFMHNYFTELKTAVFSLKHRIRPPLHGCVFTSSLHSRNDEDDRSVLVCMCTIKIFGEGAEVVTLPNPLPLRTSFVFTPSPILRCF